MARAYARAAQGQRAIGKVPWGHWKRLTVLGALATEGVLAAMSITAATSTRVFLAFIEKVLVWMAPGLQGRSWATGAMGWLLAVMWPASDAVGKDRRPRWVPRVRASTDPRARDPWLLQAAPDPAAQPTTPSRSFSLASVRETTPAYAAAAIL